MRVHILDDWFDSLRGLSSFAALEDHGVKIWTDHCDNLDELSHRLQDADALVLFRERTKISGELIARLPNLKLISQRSVYPHIDVPACTKHGVLVCSNMHADTPSIAAAELTFALILASARQLIQQVASAKAGQWQMGVGQTLAGRTLGLYGYGRIAAQVAIYARAFGMHVVWWASENGRARAQKDGVNLASSRADFFAQSDFVSVHVRLNPETHEIITAADLFTMKPSASFINTSRAGLVAKGALERALAVGRPGRFALDVFDKEPHTDASDPVLCHPQVIATPHIGYVTEDELNLQFTDIYEQINAFADGSPINLINSEVFNVE